MLQTDSRAALISSSFCLFSSMASRLAMTYSHKTQPAHHSTYNNRTQRANHSTTTGHRLQATVQQDITCKPQYNNRTQTTGHSRTGHSLHNTVQLQDTACTQAPLSYAKALQACTTDITKGLPPPPVLQGRNSFCTTSGLYWWNDPKSGWNWL